MKKSRKTKKVKEKSPEIVEIEEIQENEAGKNSFKCHFHSNLINTYPGHNVMIFQLSQVQVTFETIQIVYNTAKIFLGCNEVYNI